MKWPRGIEEWIIWIAVIAIVVAIIWGLAACSAFQQSATTVKYTKGCHIEVHSVENQQAGHMVEEIDFGDCTLGNTEEVAKKPVSKKE
jgi:hypothetical protein